jgi:hypothetical protein
LRATQKVEVALPFRGQLANDGEVEKAVHEYAYIPDCTRQVDADGHGGSPAGDGKHRWLKSPPPRCADARNQFNVALWCGSGDICRSEPAGVGAAW